jgi:hypothetical protein
MNKENEDIIGEEWRTCPVQPEQKSNFGFNIKLVAILFFLAAVFTGLATLCQKK